MSAIFEGSRKGDGRGGPIPWPENGTVNSPVAETGAPTERCGRIDFSLRLGMRVAFKEWATVVDALGHGEQIIVLRKGGISEGPAGFTVERPRFLLFPTLFHQQRESVIESAQRRFDQISAKSPKVDRVTIEYYGEIVQWHELISLRDAQALSGQHIWRDEVIAERFDWGLKKEIYAMALRVFRLLEGREMPLLPTYGGCKSWIELEEEIGTANATPVLNDHEFSRKLTEFQCALEPVAQSNQPP